MFESILVPVDGSEPSKRAVELALKVAATVKARVRFVSVVNSDALILDTEGAPFVDPEPAIENVTDVGKMALGAAADAAALLGVSATTEQVPRRTGSPHRRGCGRTRLRSHRDGEPRPQRARAVDSGQRYRRRFASRKRPRIVHPRRCAS